MYSFFQNLRLLIATLLVFSLAYPLAVVGLGQGLFHHKAQGSPVVVNGQVVGFANVGQKFDQHGYFWGRPSAVDYNAAATGGSNKGPTNPEYLGQVQERVAALHKAHPDQAGPVPTDLVTASGSGIDPDISLDAARYQAARVAQERDLDKATVLQLIDAQADRPSGIMGPPRVNLLKLNQVLAQLK